MTMIPWRGFVRCVMANIVCTQKALLEDGQITLGEKLRNLRVNTGKTLSEQSRLLKVSMNSVYRWEHDLAVPRRQILLILADYYGVPVEWLRSEDSHAVIVRDIEQKLLDMFRTLSENDQCRVLRYVEHICDGCADNDTNDAYE